MTKEDLEKNARAEAGMKDYLKEAFLFRWNLLFFLGGQRGAGRGGALGVEVVDEVQPLPGMDARRLGVQHVELGKQGAYPGDKAVPRTPRQRWRPNNLEVNRRDKDGGRRPVCPLRRAPEAGEEMVEQVW